MDIDYRQLPRQAAEILAKIQRKHKPHAVFILTDSLRSFTLEGPTTKRTLFQNFSSCIGVYDEHCPLEALVEDLAYAVDSRHNLTFSAQQIEKARLRSHLPASEPSPAPLVPAFDQALPKD